MHLTIMHLWAAGHDLPPEPVPSPPPAEPRRGKKAAKAKRRKAGK